MGLSRDIALMGCQITELIKVARIACLNELELYFGVETTEEMVNPRNEAAALSFLLQELTTSPEQGKGNVLSGLTAFINGHELTSALPCNPPVPEETPSAKHFDRWASDMGIQSAVEQAKFNGLRGAAAKVTIQPLDPVVNAPWKCLINEDTAQNSGIGQALLMLGIEKELLLLLYTMIDRHDKDSDFAPFWNSLPQNFSTGLSATEERVSRLMGTPAHSTFVEARQHIRQQYQAAQPLLQELTAAYPDDITPDMVDEDMFTWACELWYSYAIEVEYPDGVVRQALVPMAHFLNHSPWPHIIRYGRLDAITNSLRLRAFRPCSAGFQCFLSYGPLPNLKLLLFYGFALPNNPHDIVSITLEVPVDACKPMRDAVLDEHDIQLQHHLRRGPMSPHLLACLKVLAADDHTLRQMLAGSGESLTQAGAIDLDVRELLTAYLTPLLEAYKTALQRCRSSHSGALQDGFAKGMCVFLKDQIDILESNLQLMCCA
ncbi:probable actin-histidine N-methyltransferase [Coccomyxa sp. Obi]|nr:probable actin-histidine N-methyltransferase [Coccomyxa sp. Obi]